MERRLPQRCDMILLARIVAFCIAVCLTSITAADERTQERPKGLPTAAELRRTVEDAFTTINARFRLFDDSGAARVRAKNGEKLSPVLTVKQ
jgi:hypothetical protein